MVKVVFTKKKTVSEILQEAGVDIDPTQVVMEMQGEDIILHFPDSVDEEKIAKLEKHMVSKGFKRR